MRFAQERWNADRARQHGLGVVHRGLGSVRKAVAEITRRLPEFRARVGRTDNRAVFEVPQILERILEANATAPRGQRRAPATSSA